MSDLQHPCRYVCSGWKQGFEEGAKEVAALKSELADSKEREAKLMAERDALRAELAAAIRQRDDESGVLELVAEERDSLRAALIVAKNVLEWVKDKCECSELCSCSSLMVANAREALIRIAELEK